MKLLIVNCVSDNCELGLYRGLKDRGIDIDLIVDPRESQQESLRAHGIPVVEFEIKNRFDFSAVNYLRSRIATKGYDAIYAPTSRGITACLTATRQMIQSPGLITYRGTIGHLSRFSLLSRRSHLNRRVDRIVCNCEAVKEFVRSVGVPTDKLPVVYKGHNPAWYQPETSFNRSDFNIPENAFVIGCVANVRPLKGIEIILGAIARLKDSHPIYLLQIGSVSDQRIVKKAAALGVAEQVRFLGFVKKPQELIAGCNLTIMASLYREGVARSVIESLCLRVPVIVARTGGLADVITDGKNGLVTMPGSVAELAGAIQRLLDDQELHNRLATGGFNFVSEVLNVDDYVSNMLSVFHAAAQSRAPKEIGQQL